MSEIVSQALFILTYWKVYMETFFIIWPTHLPVLETNACSVLSLHWSLSLKVIFIITWSLRSFHPTHNFLWPITTDLVHSGSFFSQHQAVLPTDPVILGPGSDSAFKQGAQNWILPWKQNKMQRKQSQDMPLHLLKLLLYFVYALGHEVCIRLSILEEHEVMGSGRVKLNEWSIEPHLLQEPQREWNKRKPGEREWGHARAHVGTHLLCRSFYSQPHLPHTGCSGAISRFPVRLEVPVRS